MPGLFIGTSGWNYDHWNKGFYAGVRRQDQLCYYAEQFDSVEVNASFYRLQTPETLTRWRRETPEHFCFTLKGNRYLTHNKKLKDPAASVERERDNSHALGNKLAAVLWQLPGNLAKNTERLQGFCQALSNWSEVRHAIEFRHPSWFDTETAGCLGTYGIANCQSDAADWPMWKSVTTNLVYIRLHGHTRTYASAYQTGTLTTWANAIRNWQRENRAIHVYFDNDAEGAAPKDAMRLKKLLKKNCGWNRS